MNYCFIIPAISPAGKLLNAGLSAIIHQVSRMVRIPVPTKIPSWLKETNEQAVMVDTYAPLFLTQQSKDLEDPDYPTSWQETKP